MSYVKVALTDENLFVRPDHPARRLLDTLALSCESNDGGSPQDRELLERASATVSRVVAEFNEDMAIFELADRRIAGPAAAATPARGNRRTPFGGNRAWPRTAAAGAAAGGIGTRAARLGTSR